MRETEEVPELVRGQGQEVERTGRSGELAVPKLNWAVLNNISASMISPGRYQRPLMKVSLTADVVGVMARIPGRNPSPSLKVMLLRPSPETALLGPARVKSSPPESTTFPTLTQAANA